MDIYDDKSGVFTRPDYPGILEVDGLRLEQLRCGDCHTFIYAKTQRCGCPRQDLRKDIQNGHGDY